MLHRPLVIAAVAYLAVGSSAAEFRDVDICIYGATSGGVAAAVQASRLGKSAIIVEPGRHIGGMSSGGLGATDTGNRGAIGGIAREFYRRVGQRYNLTESFTFEPTVAEQTFSNMLREASVSVVFNSRLTSIEKTNARIRSLRTQDGSMFRARMFIDATYEGDLMAAAGVSFTVGRESTNIYGETLNGIRPTTPSHQFTLNVDPYVVPGDPTSGLLLYIQSGDGGTPGDGDHRVQAYNFRLCLTQVASNRVAITAPTNYDAGRYELLARWIEARQTNGLPIQVRNFLSVISMPNGKTDINNNGPFSTDFIGRNYDYPTANYTDRARIWREHEDYIRGLLYFLGNSPRVPAVLRSEMLTWGLCRDEFQDTGGWPHQLYVREARRMVSDYVMTQQNCQGSRIPPDSIGLGSYTMDSHNCQRIVQGGFTKNEGDVQSPTPAPYRISYRSIVPRESECENLLVTFCLSASHIAFGSCRMEPVFMITSQSAATAASFAIDQSISAVQQVPIEKLQLQLLADRQILNWGSTPSSGVIDNNDPGVLITGAWTPSTSQAGFYGSDYIHNGAIGQGTKSARFTPNLTTAGAYNVYARWTAHANREPIVPIDVIHAKGTNTHLVNQTINGAQWVLLGSYDFQAGDTGSVLIRTDETTGFVIADAVWFEPVGFTNKPTVQIVASDPFAGEFRTNTARVTIIRGGETNQALTVNYSVEGSGSPGVDFQALPGTATLAPGVLSTSIVIRPFADTLVEGPEEITIRLGPSSAYMLGNFLTAELVIEDRPFDNWRHNVFTAEELADPATSGIDADPDGDGNPNAVEYALGLDAHDTDRSILQIKEFTEGRLTVFYHRPKGYYGYSDVAYRVEMSDDLINWQSGAAYLEQTGLEEIQFYLDRVTLRQVTPAASRAFIRLAIELLE